MGNGAQRIPSWPGATAPTKAAYICADQPVTFTFRLRQGGGPYIPDDHELLASFPTSALASGDYKSFDSSGDRNEIADSLFDLYRMRPECRCSLNARANSRRLHRPHCAQL